MQIHWNGKQLNLGSFILESFELFVLLTKIIDEIYVAISESIARRSNLLFCSLIDTAYPAAGQTDANRASF